MAKPKLKGLARSTYILRRLQLDEHLRGRYKSTNFESMTVDIASKSWLFAIASAGIVITYIVLNSTIKRPKCVMRGTVAGKVTTSLTGTVTYKVSTAASQGLAKVNGSGEWTYKPVKNHDGSTDSFIITVSAPPAPTPVTTTTTNSGAGSSADLTNPGPVTTANAGPAAGPAPGPAAGPAAGPAPGPAPAAALETEVHNISVNQGFSNGVPLMPDGLTWCFWSFIMLAMFYFLVTWIANALLKLTFTEHEHYIINKGYREANESIDGDVREPLQKILRAIWNFKDVNPTAFATAFDDYIYRIKTMAHQGAQTKEQTLAKNMFNTLESHIRENKLEALEASKWTRFQRGEWAEFCRQS
jgi:hypothetical protein